MVPPLRPRIGEQDEDAAERCRGQRREQQPRVIGEQADIAEAAPRHLAEPRDDAVLEHLAADKPDLGVPLGLGGKVLAGAEADLEPDCAAGFGKKGGGSTAPTVAGRSTASCGSRSSWSRRWPGRSGRARRRP